MSAAPLRFDLLDGGLPLRTAGDLAQRAASAGFSGLVFAEAGRTA